MVNHVDRRNGVSCIQNTHIVRNIYGRITTTAAWKSKTMKE